MKHLGNNLLLSRRERTLSTPPLNRVIPLADTLETGYMLIRQADAYSHDSRVLFESTEPGHQVEGGKLEERADRLSTLGNTLMAIYVNSD